MSASFLLIAQPSNDDCAGAVLLTPSANMSCTPTDGTTVSVITKGYDNCLVVEKRNVWYQFTATSSSHIIQVTRGTIQEAAIDVFGGDCDGLYELTYCSNASTDPVIQTELNNLNAGEVYKVTVSTLERLDVNYDGTFSICILTPEIPPNDECVNATGLIPSADETCGATDGTNASGIVNRYDGCIEREQYDVWYKFTATSTSHTVRVTLGTMQEGFIDVFESDCDNLVKITSGCNPSSGPVMERNLSGLIIGEEYKVSVSTVEEEHEGTFSICILTPGIPTNDECVNATVLAVNPSNLPGIRTTGNTLFATESMAGCTGTADDDVWFSFTATQTSHLIHLFYSNGYFSVEAFSGACGSLTSIVCVTPDDIHKVALLPGLTPGLIYFVRVYSNTGTFDSRGTFSISITSPPVNDDCANAHAIIPSPNGSDALVSSVEGATFNATQSSPDCFGGSSTSNDTWFKFTASQAVHQVKSYGLGNTTRFEIFGGTCAGLTSLFCSTPVFYEDTATAKVNGLNEGETYFVRVYSSEPGMFNMFVTSPVFPQNDECADALTIMASGNSLPDYVNGTTEGSTRVDVPGACYGGRDVWFAFDAVSVQHLVQVKNLTNNDDLTIELFSGECGALVHQRCNYGDTLFGIGNLTIDEAYFVRISTNNTFIDDDFKIAVTTPVTPVNDECIQAVTITPSNDAACNSISGTIDGATQSQKENCGGNALMGQVSDVWYKFIATSTAHRVRLTKRTGTLKFQIFDGSCESLVSLGCSANLSGDAGTGVEARYDGLSIGNTYLIRILNTSSELTGTFEVCVKTAVVPANNECTSAITLTPQNNLTFGVFTSGTTTDATASGQPAGCIITGGEDDDVWYQFTASQSNMKIVLQNGTIGSTQIGVYSGTCGALTGIKCVQGHERDNYVPLTGLTPGSAYFIRVYSLSLSSQLAGSFAIMVTTFEPPVNDVCSNAIELIPSDSSNCTNPVQGTTIDAVSEGDVACASDRDVWYKFTATATMHRVNVEGLGSSVIGIYSGSCAGLTSLPGSCVGGPAGTSLSAGSLTIGDTYFVRLSFGAAGFNQSVFSICVITPQVPVNDQCAGAIPLSVDINETTEPSQHYSTALATFTAPLNCVAFTNDVWFSFVAPQGPVSVEVTALNADAAMEVLTGTCGALTSVWCNGEVSTRLNNIFNGSDLSEGSTYYVRVSAISFDTDLEFKIKVYKNSSIKVNSAVSSECVTENIVQNPGLENDLFIPTSFIADSYPGKEYIYDWRIPTMGTSDFFNSNVNTPGSAVEIPNNTCFGYQSARNGAAYAGFFAYSSGGTGYREYLENELSEPLVPGKKYLVSMYVSLADFSTIATDDIGIAFKTEQTIEFTSGSISLTPQVAAPEGIFIEDKINWVNISAVITADQPYRYLLIGNFKNNVTTDTLRVTDPSGQLSGGTFAGCATASHVAYYFVDDVLVAEIDETEGAPCSAGTIKLDQTITFDPIEPVSEGDAPFLLTATASSGLAVSYQSSDLSVASVNGNEVTIVSAGSTVITATQAGNDDFNAAPPVSRQLIVNSLSKQNQAITFGALPPVTVGTLPFKLNATASSGLPVSYASSDPAVASVSGNTVTVLRAGTTDITASQSGDDDFNPAPDQTQTLIVNEVTTGLEEAANTILSPNPAEEEVRLPLHSCTGHVTWQIIDRLGRVVKQTECEGKTEIKVGIQELNPGIYFMKVQNGAKQQTYRFVKK